MLLYHSGFGVIAAIFPLALVASFLTILTSPFLLWLYRRAVARLMATQAGTLCCPVVTDEQPEHAYSRTHVDRGNYSPKNLYHLTISESWIHAYKYGVAGILFALLMGLSGFFAYSQTQLTYLKAASHPFQFLFMFWIFIWPSVLTINIVATNSLKNKSLITLGYFIVLIVLGGITTLIPTEAPFQIDDVSTPSWSGETPIRLIGKWSIFNLAPTFLLFLFQNRRVRAVVPLVLSFMTVVSAGVLGFIVLGYNYQEAFVSVMTFVFEKLGLNFLATVTGYYLLLFAIACLLFGVFGWWLIIRIRNGYLDKTSRDQSLAIDALWLIFISFYAVMLAFAGPGWALLVLIIFVIFKFTVNAGNRILHSRSNDRNYNSSLLVLRVFSLGKRSETLFDAVSRQWRQIGNVKLIAGTDLAHSTVAPHQFLAFVSGKLSQLFIDDDTTMNRNLAELDTRRDHDGRFRINDFFCYANTWQSVLLSLVKNTGVVLMDLRSFSESKAGCIFEIKELLNNMPLRYLIFVIDDTTDKEFLKQTLEQAYRELSSYSPNLGRSASEVQIFELKSSRFGEIQELIRKLCEAIGSGN